jgi:hypothetical protein
MRLSVVSGAVPLVAAAVNTVAVSIIVTVVVANVARVKAKAANRKEFIKTNPVVL